MRLFLLLPLLIACGDADTSPADTTPTPDTTPDIADTAPDTPDIAPDTADSPDTPDTNDTPDTTAPALWPHTLSATPRLITPFAVADPLRVQPALALGEDHRLALAWTGRVGDSLGIALSLMTLDDTPEAAGSISPFIAHTDTTGLRNEPSLCALTGGGYALAWSVDLQNGLDNLQVAFRRFGPDLTPLDPSDRVLSTDRPGNHWLAELACDPRGGFVLAGVRPGPEDSGFSAFFVRVDASGTASPATSALDADPTGGSAFAPQLAVSPTGEVLLIWEQTGLCQTAPCGDTTRLLYRRFPATGPASALGFLPHTGDASGAVAAFDSSVTSGPSSLALLGGAVGSTLTLWLEDGSPPTPLALPTLGVTTSSAAVSPGAGRFDLVHFQGTGQNVALILQRLDQTTFAAPLTLDSGSFPLAYRPALAARAELRVAAWTESMGQNRFRVRLAALTSQ